MADNVAILKDAYRRWHESKGRSVQHWVDLLADDVCFGSLAGGVPGLEFTRQCMAKADVKRYFDGLHQDWEMIHYTVERFVADGDRVAVQGSTSWRHRRTGKSFDSAKADFFTLRDGKITEFFEYYDTAMVLEATRA
jgi:ketosteroid isomerase-like protein